jgi:hypothetical protein
MFQSKNSNVSLSRSCVQGNDDVSMKTFIQHFLLVSSRDKQGVCGSRRCGVSGRADHYGRLAEVAPGLWY